MVNRVFKRVRDYEIFFQKSPVPVFEVDLSGKITNVNSAGCNLLGYTADELKQITFDQITIPVYLPADRKLFQDIIDGRIDQYDIVKGYITKSGLKVYQHLYVYADKDEDNNLLRFLSILVPVSGYNTKLWSIAAKSVKIFIRVIAFITMTTLALLAKKFFNIDITSFF